MVAKTAEELNDLSNRIIGIAIDIHKKLGPGFQKKIYPVRKPQHLCRGWWKWKVSAGYWGRSQSPALSNGVYEEAFLTEFKKSGIGYEKQKVVRVDYDGQGLGNQRIDLLADDEVILEIKACTKIIPIYRDQVISYLKTANKKLGLILNFGRSKLEIKRVVHNF